MLGERLGEGKLRAWLPSRAEASAFLKTPEGRAGSTPPTHSCHVSAGLSDCTDQRRCSGGAANKLLEPIGTALVDYRS